MFSNLDQAVQRLEERGEGVIACCLESGVL
jgi:hypothetical protein